MRIKPIAIAQFAVSVAELAAAEANFVSTRNETAVWQRSRRDILRCCRLCYEVARTLVNQSMQIRRKALWRRTAPTE